MRWTRLVPVLATVGGVLLACGGDDGVAPGPSPLVLRILEPASQQTLSAGAEVTLRGEASALDLGPLPEDSVWWTVDDSVIAQGSHAETALAPGIRRVGFHAQHGQRSAETFVDVNVLIPPAGALRR